MDLCLPLHGKFCVSVRLRHKAIKPFFQCITPVDGVEVAKGTGATKQKAREEAASEALKSLGLSPQVTGG